MKANSKIWQLAVLVCTSLSFALTDGPYVFHTPSEIVVQSIVDSVVTTTKFDPAAPVSITVPAIGKVPSFSVPLRKTFTPEPSTYAKSDTILVTSDFEGNIEAAYHLLKSIGAVDEKVNWKFGSAHIVFNGDMFDRGEHVAELLWMIYKLQGEAKAAGGGVHYIVGNHDHMNLMGDLRYLHEKYTRAPGVLGKTYMDLYTAETELGRWIRSFNTIEQIGNYTFVHAGISPTVLYSGLTVDNLNMLCRDNLNKVQHGDTKVRDFSKFTAESFATTNYDSTYLFHGSWGPMWYRGYFQESSGKYSIASQGQIDSILTAFKTKRIVVGHTVVNTVASKYNGGVIAMDIHHAETYDAKGYVEAFLVEKGVGYSYKTTGERKFVINDGGELPSYTLAVTGSKGTAVITPKKESYKANDTVTVVVTPEQGYDFSHWKSGFIGTNDSIQIVIAENTNLEFFCTDYSTALTFTYGINSSMDDVEETGANGKVPGKMYTNSSDLELTYDGTTYGNQYIGLRFSNVAIPAGMEIKDAKLNFHIYNTKDANIACSLKVEGEKVPDANPFTTTAFDVSNRAKTSASTIWKPTWIVENWYSTPAVTDIVQEIVDQAGWKKGNSILFSMSGVGALESDAYDYDPKYSPKLEVTFIKKGSVSVAPKTVVSAKPLFVSANGSVSLQLPVAGNYAIQLFMLNGRVIRSESTFMNAGIRPVQTNTLASGFYVCKIVGPNGINSVNKFHVK